MSATVPDGVYDNRATMRREEWRDGERIGFVNATLIAQKKPPHARVPPVLVEAWGTYPDLPKGTAS